MSHTDEARLVALLGELKAVRAAARLVLDQYPREPPGDACSAAWRTLREVALVAAPEPSLRGGVVRL